MKKLLVIGDSILKGVYLTEDTHHFKLYRDRNFPTMEERGIQVKNVSKMGACIAYGAGQLDKNMDYLDRSATVLLSFGGNDCGYRWKEISENPDAEHFCLTPPEKFIKIFSQCIDKAKEKAGRVVLMNLFPIKASLYIDTISKGLNRQNIMRWLGDVETLGRWHEHYNRIVERLATQKDCILADIRDAFLKDRRAGEYICSDGIHPTPAGHGIIHGVIEEALL